MFFDENEKRESEIFINKGYIVKKSDDYNSLLKIQDIFGNILEKKFNIKNSDLLEFLNSFHHHISLDKLNEFRVEFINQINNEPVLRNLYFLSAKKTLYNIVGNELVMQNMINLSIQLPNDNTSLLPIHSDTWSGDSPYEVVVWIPMVDCYNTKSMYILPPCHYEELQLFFKKNPTASSDTIFEYIKEKVEWIKINFGEILIFNQNLPHGNVVNTEEQTRWSMNCRFKSIFSPYGDKKIGEFFEPITPRAISKIGMNYKFPDES